MRAIEGMNMQIFGGRRVVAQFAQANYVPRQSRAASTPTNTLYVGNISYDMTDKDLQDLFRDIRNVIDVRVSIDRKTGQPKGFAHAEFTDVASAQAAFEILRSKAPFGRRLRVDFSLTNRQSKRRDERENVSAEQVE
jgi:nucleolin